MYQPYITVWNPRKIAYLEMQGIEPIDDYGKFAKYPRSKRVKDALDEWDILVEFGSAYLGQPAGHNRF